MFKDRLEAGRLLAEKLSRYKEDKTVIVLGIPRGGVVVASKIAELLGAELDVFVVKKLGYPGNEELALGAVGIDDYYLNEDLTAGIHQGYIREEVRAKQLEIKERLDELRGNRKLYSLKNKIVILVDDGVATGATMTLAVKLVRRQNPKSIIVAVPVAPLEALKRLKEAADEVVCLEVPLMFFAIGQFYENFTQVETGEAKKLLEEGWKKRLVLTKRKQSLKAR